MQMKEREQDQQLAGDFISGMWRHLKVKNIPKHQRSHCWVFMDYMEAPSSRNDNRWYEALLFRNQDRTAFGIKEFDSLVHHNVIHRIAARVIYDEAFRQELLSDHPALPKIWKRR
jgi:hypothetical protein